MASKKPTISITSRLQPDPLTPKTTLDGTRIITSETRCGNKVHTSTAIPSGVLCRESLAKLGV